MKGRVWVSIGQCLGRDREGISKGSGWEVDGIYSTESGGVTEGKMDARDKEEIR